MKKQFTSLVLLFLFLRVTCIFCQSDVYDSYLTIKIDPLNSDALNIVEEQAAFNYIDLIFILSSNIAQGNEERTRELLLELTRHGFDIESLQENLEGKSMDILGIVQSDQDFQEIYENSILKNQDRIVNDSISEGIKYMYRIDQDARRLFRLLGNGSYLETIDSLNLQIAIIMMDNDLIDSKTYGWEREKDLYTILLHACRYVTEQEWLSIDKQLRRFVDNKKFNPYYYANIVDERLRVNNSIQYPKYNFLRKLVVSDSTQIEINKNRKEINAY